MSDEWLSITDQQLHDRTIAAGENESGGTRGSASGFFATIFETMAVLFAYAWRVAIRPIATHIDPRVAKGFFLQQHALMAGTPYRVAAKTRGYMTVASVAGGRLVVGDRIIAGNAVFVVDQAVRIAAGGSVLVPVTAEQAGAAGNVAPGSDAEFSPVPERLEDGTVTLQAQWVTFPGHAADDDDESLRARTLVGYQITGDHDIEARYREAALRVDGVSSVAARRTPRGYGSADVVVLVRGLLPTQAELQLVEAALNDAGLVGEDTWTRAPSIITVSVNVTFTGTASEADVEDAITAWWRAQVGIGDGVLVQSLYNDAHGSVFGITSIDYDSPADNLPARPAVWYSPSVRATRA